MTASLNGPARGRRRDHRQHADDGRRLPAARLRRRPRQPVLPAVRPDRHVRPAGVAHLRADGRAGPRLLPHRQGQAQRRRGRRAEELDLGPRLHPDDQVRPALAAGPRSASSPCAGVLFFASLALVPLLPTQFINAGSEKILQVTRRAADRHQLGGRPRAGHRGRDDPPRRPRRRARPDERPRRGRHELPDDHRRPERPAGQQRHADRPPRAETPTSPRRPPELSAALAPIKTDGYDVQVVGGRRLHVERPHHHRQRRRPGRRRGGHRRGRRRPRRTTPTSSTSRATSSRPRPEIQVTVDPNKAIAVGLTAAQVADEVRTALVAADRHPGHVRADGQPDRPHRPGRPGGDHVGRGRSRRCRSGRSPRCRSARSPTVEQVDVQGSITRIDQAPAASITAEITSDDTGAVSQSVQAEIDALEADGRDPGRRQRRARRRQPAADRGVRRPVRLDGRRHPARLRDDGPDLQLAHHAVHHPVQPAARDDRRLPGAVRHRAPDRRQRAHRVPDAHRHRGHERDRPARPRRAAAVRGQAHA